MDYQALQRKLTRYFAELQTLSTLPEMDRNLNIRECIDNATSYIEEALEIARNQHPKPSTQNPNITVNTAPEQALDPILALEDSHQLSDGIEPPDRDTPATVTRVKPVTEIICTAARPRWTSSHKSCSVITAILEVSW